MSIHDLNAIAIDQLILLKEGDQLLSSMRVEKDEKVTIFEKKGGKSTQVTSRLPKMISNSTTAKDEF